MRAAHIARRDKCGAEDARAFEECARVRKKFARRFCSRRINTKIIRFTDISPPNYTDGEANDRGGDKMAFGEIFLLSMIGGTALISTIFGLFMVKDMTWK